MNLNSAEKLIEKFIARTAVLTAAVVLCALFSAFSPSIIAAEFTGSTAVSGRAEKFLASHPNKIEAQKIINRGFAKMYNAVKSGSKQRIETVMNLAVADYWKIRRYNPQLHRNTPPEQHPMLTAGTGSGSSAVVPQTQRDVLTLLTLSAVLPSDGVVYEWGMTSPAEISIIVPQRNLPLVI